MRPVNIDPGRKIRSQIQIDKLAQGPACRVMVKELDVNGAQRAAAVGRVAFVRGRKNWSPFQGVFQV